MSQGTDIETSGAAVVAALAAVYTAYLAKQASADWRKGLEHQRIDEAISALHELRNRINRVVSLGVVPLI